MISPAEAEAIIRANVPVRAAESLVLDRLCGSVLREEIRATRDQPPFDRVTMDGVAFAQSAYAAGRRTFKIAGTQAAGASPLVLEDRTTCIEVMTGAMVPHGCDCVVPVEKLSIRDGTAELAEDAAASPGLNIHRTGIDCRAGQLLLSPHTRLGPTQIAVIASAGLASAAATPRPRIVVISTGDELVEPGYPVAEWQIYRSNAYAVVAALRNRGFEHVGQDHLPDDLPVLRDRLAAHLERNDALILSGGVSMGRFDYVPQVLQELGVKPVFHKISQRPGKPMWFGVGSAGQCVYALPGNPVSTLVCLARYVYRGLAVAEGVEEPKAESAVLDSRFEVKPTLTFFLPVSLASDGATLLAHARPTQGSGDFTSLLGTHGFVELPPGPTLIPEGTVVPLYRW